MTTPPSGPAAHLILHRRPPTVRAGGSLRINGRVVATVALTAQQQSLPFSLSFETAAERLSRLPRMFVEPDGSFVWVSPSGEAPVWQLDGVVNDRGDRVVAVEIKGGCPRPPLEQLLRAFDWPENALLVQLVRSGAFLEVEEFLRIATRPDQATPEAGP